MQANRWTGIVRRYNPDKGYGFVENDEAGENDIFLHASEWHHPLPLSRGMKVSFKIGLDKSGRPCAKAARAL